MGFLLFFVGGKKVLESGARSVFGVNTNYYCAKISSKTVSTPFL